MLWGAWAEIFLTQVSIFNQQLLVINFVFHWPYNVALSQRTYRLANSYMIMKEIFFLFNKRFMTDLKAIRNLIFSIDVQRKEVKLCRRHKNKYQKI